MLSEKARRSFEKTVHKGQIVTDPVELITYEIDAGFDRRTPEGVAFPQSVEDVIRLVHWANEHRVPLIARGAGTGLSGGAVAEQGGIIVEFSRMKRIVQFDERGRRAIVEPGITNLSLDEFAKQKGLYYPPDPSSQRASTLGGNVAENAGGAHCFKYGVTTNYVLSLEMVLADGRVVHVGGRALDYPEFDLGGLVVGSEGTLALITSIGVRLVRNPPGAKTMMIAFDSVEQAGEAVSAVIAAGLVPAAMEMMDQSFTRIVEEHAQAGLPTDAGAVLIVEVDGYPANLDAQVNEIAQLFRERHGRDLRVARNAQEREQIWYARKSAAGAFSRLAPAYYLVDITVPRSRLAETIAELHQVSDRYELRVCYVFHAGDGNLHPVILIPDPGDAHLIERVHRAARDMVDIAIHKEGSITGEHGVGIEKREYMPLMYNHAELSAMWDVKQCFDPHNRLNPGKIFPSPILKEARVTTTRKFPDDFAPASVEEASAALASFYAQGRRVQIGRSVQGDAVSLSTARLTGIKVYAPEDLYTTVGAGTRLSELQAFLAHHQQQLPLASPWADATIGGIIAANANAPLRMRHGSIRDLVLAMTIVLGDGRIIRAGRPVVKNVAGYDLPKVFVGSHGTLGLIADVTLKLAPLPRARRTLLVPVADLARGLEYTSRLLPRARVASAIVLARLGDAELRTESWTSPYVLAYTVEGMLGDVEEELKQVRLELQRADAPMPVQAESLTGTDIWAAVLRNTRADSLILRVGVPSEDLVAFLQSYVSTLERGTFVADIANGMVYAIAAPDSVASARAYVNTLRQAALIAGGYTVVMQAPETWRQTLDLWGYRPETLDLMVKLKTCWDPGGILNPDHFVLRTNSFEKN